MAKNANPENIARRYACLTPEQAASGVVKLRRLAESLAKARAPKTAEEAWPVARDIAARVNATLRDVYGPETVEAREHAVQPRELAYTSMSMGGPPTPFHRYFDHFQFGISSVRRKVDNLIHILSEKAAEDVTKGVFNIISAYKNLALHQAIADTASALYVDGHYANAIEDAVKALNNLVRLKSGSDLDGDKLMTTVFSVEKPKIRFNDLQDESDRNEQRGFMMMFAGAVAGLRNPRAHKLIRDDPEQALEFIAYVSLLAKLLEQSTKVNALV